MQKLSSVAFSDVALLVDGLSRLHISEPLVIDPALVATDTLHKTSYLEHFPWQVLATADPGLSVKPSACLSVYEHYQNAQLETGVESLILAPVYRTESKSEMTADRLNGFWMLEYVYIDSPESVASRADELARGIPLFFKELGLAVEPVFATDAFFLEESQGSKLIQQMKQLKTEFQNPQDGVALASLNKHEDYFTTKYGIKSSSSTAQSLCFALGVDRISSALGGTR